MDYKHSNRDENGREILVAIDFGQTYSSVGYVVASEPEKRTLISSWTSTAPKTDWVPTTIKYDKDVGPYKWGYQLSEDEIKHEHFKLALVPDFEALELAKWYPSRTALPRVYGEEAKRLVIDYLHGLRERVDEHLMKTFGEAVVKTFQPHYFLTVPAIWPEKAQSLLKTCAESSGMGNRITMMAEPEAAAFYALELDNLDLKIDDTFVLCDAGGCTVDLISYTVKRLGSWGSSPLISESGPGTGGVCGSSYLNRKFDQYLSERFGNHPRWDDDCNQKAMQAFEDRIKREFDGDPQKSFSIGLADLPNSFVLGIRKGKVEIPGTVLLQLFEPVIQEITSLVLGQVRNTNRRVTAVVLVGGFGSSKYLKARLQRALLNESNGARVVQIPDSATAVVKGALIRAIAEISDLESVRVTTRVARKHYGTPLRIHFDPAIHDVARKYFDPKTGDSLVTGMHWVISKGDVIQESTATIFKFYWTGKMRDGPPGTFKMSLYTSDADIAPLYQDSVKKLVEFEADLSKIPRSEFKIELGQSGEKFYGQTCEIEMKLFSASSQFALIVNGKRYDIITHEFME